MKRSGEEIEFDVSDMHVAKHAKVHGVMTEISPMKESRKGSKYSNGTISDGKTSACFVCFDKKMYEKLSSISAIKKSLVASNCEVKESDYVSGLEVVRNTSEVRSSRKIVQVSEDMFVKARESVIVSISGFAKNEVVSVQVKVLCEKSPVEVKKGLVKQEYCIADSSACCRIVTWGDNIGLLSVDGSYKLSGLIVRTYQDEKYLSVPREGFHVAGVEDIGVVVEVPEESPTERELLYCRSESLEKFESCYSCLGRVKP